MSEFPTPAEIEAARAVLAKADGQTVRLMPLVDGDSSPETLADEAKLYPAEDEVPEEVVQEFPEPRPRYYNLTYVTGASVQVVAHYLHSSDVAHAFYANDNEGISRLVLDVRRDLVTTVQEVLPAAPEAGE